MLEQDIAYRAPEISPISGEGVFMIGFNIPFFRGLNIFNGLGCFLVVIERRQQARLYDVGKTGREDVVDGVFVLTGGRLA